MSGCYSNDISSWSIMTTYHDDVLSWYIMIPTRYMPPQRWTCACIVFVLGCGMLVFVFVFWQRHVLFAPQFVLNVCSCLGNGVHCHPCRLKCTSQPVASIWAQVAVHSWRACLGGIAFDLLHFLWIWTATSLHWVVCDFIQRWMINTVYSVRTYTSSPAVARV